MKTLRLFAFIAFAVLSGFAQSPFYIIPARILGQNPDPNSPGASRSYAPNLVEGRELWSPQSIAVDTSVSPPILYIADTNNNRVLAWRDATTANLAPVADLVIGQPDRYATTARNPNSRTGLYQPSALAVDSQGNLYVLDTGNHRVLRFPKPFQDDNEPKRPNAVIGQPDFATLTANTGGISEKTLNSGSLLPGALVFDAAGNLWVTDGGNHRVLQYKKDDLDRAGSQQIGASVVLGQSDFATSTSTNTFSNASKFNNPLALTLDSAGRLYVADRMSRILVFVPAQFSGQSATRIVGQLTTGGQIVQPPTNKSLYLPHGLFAVGENLYVSDTLNNRILRFDPFTQWPASETPVANAVIGQVDFTKNESRVGNGGLGQPMHAAVAGNEIYLADYANNRAVVYPVGATTSSRIVGQLSAQFNGPNLVEGKDLYLAGTVTSDRTFWAGGGVAVDMRAGIPAPRLYIADTFNHRVLGFCDSRAVKFGDSADLVIGQPTLNDRRPNYNADGTTARNDSNLNGPIGLVLDAQGNLFVADWGNSRVLRFPDPCGHKQGPHRANLVIGQSDFTTRDTAASDRYMAEPYGVGLMPEGHLLVSDRVHNRVLLFKKPENGDFVNGQRAATVFGQPNFISTSPTTASQSAPITGMNDPRLISVDTSGRLYVPDSRNRRILIFTEVATAQNGAPAAISITSGLQGQNMNEPHAVYVSPMTGQIWTASSVETRILRYPEFLQLSVNSVADLSISTVVAGLGLALDTSGNLFLTDLGNRLSLYVPPAVATDGANFVSNGPLAPGMIATLWAVAPQGAPGFRGVQTSSFDWFSPALIPLPTTLSDTQVLVNGSPAPLYYVSASQINFQVPKGVAENGLAELQVVRASTGEILAAGIAQVKFAQPRFLMHNDAPFSAGQVAAQNGDDQANPTCNGPEGPAIPGFCPGGVRPVKRNEVLAIYLIGSGKIPGDTTPDGAQAPNTANDALRSGLRVFIGATEAQAQYSGPAPGLINVWQLNVKVPENTAPGQAPIAVIYRDVPSSVLGVPKTFITVK